MYRARSIRLASFFRPRRLGPAVTARHQRSSPRSSSSCPRLRLNVFSRRKCCTVRRRLRYRRPGTEHVRRQRGLDAAIVSEAVRDDSRIVRVSRVSIVNGSRSIAQRRRGTRIKKATEEKSACSGRPRRILRGCVFSSDDNYPSTTRFVRFERPADVTGDRTIGRVENFTPLGNPRNFRAPIAITSCTKTFIRNIVLPTSC